MSQHTDTTEPAPTGRRSALGYRSTPVLGLPATPTTNPAPWATRPASGTTWHDPHPAALRTEPTHLVCDLPEEVSARADR